MIQKEGILQGDMLKAITKLGYPLALASIAQTLYNLADTFWLGKLGKDALSAPIISFFILFLALSVGMGFATAGTALVSQYTGANQGEKARLTAGNLLTSMILLSFVCAAIGLIFDKYWLTLMNTPPELMETVHDYYWILMAGLPLSFPIFVYQSVMNGYGDTMSPLRIELITAALNAVLDPLFIFGWLGFPAMGVKGAAVTTLATRALASAIGMYYFFSNRKGFKIRWRHLKPDREILSLLFRIGSPSALGHAGTSIGFNVLMGFVNLYGAATVSAYGISIRVTHFFMMPAMGISAAVTTMVGQNLGAGNIQRAKEAVRKGMIVMLWVIVPASALLMIFGYELTRFFIPGDPAVHEIGSRVFLIATPSIVFYGAASVMQAAFQGAGYNWPVVLVNFARLWGFRIPFVYLVSFVLLGGVANPGSSDGIWWSITFSTAMSFLLMWIWHHKGSWCKPRIREAINASTGPESFPG